MGEDRRRRAVQGALVKRFPVAAALLLISGAAAAQGWRSVSEIRDILSGRYSPVPVPEISEYFDLLARAKAVSLK